MVLAYNKNWKYQTIGSIPSSRIVYPMATTPVNRNLSIQYSPYMGYSNIDLGYYGKWPWPSQDWSICFVDGNLIKSVSNPVYAFGSSRRCTVAIWAKDSNDTIGNRIWHEIIHAHGINADLLGPNQPNSDFPAFSQYVRSDPYWRTQPEIIYYLNNTWVNPYTLNVVSRAYYTMLWKRYGFPIG